jgi:hypothetical protein
MEHFISHAHPSLVNPILLYPIQSFFTSQPWSPRDMQEKLSKSSVIPFTLFTSLTALGCFSLAYFEDLLWNWDHILALKPQGERSY